jgi:antirestriction protein ArdC
MAYPQPTKEQSEIHFQQLLEEAVAKPGTVMKAYSRFWRYSVGNQLLALVQCYQRGIEPGPMATFPKWKELGRYVRKGERALTLCMPITHKRTEKDTATGEEAVITWQSFTYKPRWFVVSQTDGADVQPEPVPAWDSEKALQTLGIEKAEFRALDGNMQGYAAGHSFSVNPVAQLPVKTTFHELAHIVLGHTSENAVNDSETTPRSLREAEAESVALICLESLGLDGAEFCRGYIQSWLNGQTIPERSAQKIFHAADKILKAGIERQSQGGGE